MTDTANPTAGLPRFAVLRWVFMNSIPFYIRYYLPRSWDPFPEFRPSRTSYMHFWRDLTITAKLIFRNRVLPFSRTVLGIPNKGFLHLLGIAPHTELHFSIRMLWEAAVIFGWTFVGAGIAFCTLIPGLCILYPLSSWGVTWVYVHLKKKEHLSRILRLFSSRFQANSRQPSRWYYVNGICNTEYIALQGIERINQLFHTAEGDNPNTALIYNPTQGVFLDIMECVLGRTFNWPGIPGYLVYKEVSKALKDPEVTHVVLIGHSQGCIIVSSFLGMIEHRWQTDNWTNSEVSKLEVYLFAAPTDVVPSPRASPDDPPQVYMEHFANHEDAVARFGILNPEPTREEYESDYIFFNKERHGHILNEHYLYDFHNHPYVNSLRPERVSKLYSYMNLTSVEDSKKNN